MQFESPLSTSSARLYAATCHPAASQVIHRAVVEQLPNPNRPRFFSCWASRCLFHGLRRRFPAWVVGLPALVSQTVPRSHEGAERQSLKCTATCCHQGCLCWLEVRECALVCMQTGLCRDTASSIDFQDCPFQDVFPFFLSCRYCGKSNWSADQPSIWNNPGCHPPFWDQI